MTQRVLFVALALVVAGGQAAAAQRERTMRFEDLDRNNDGRITRDEWRGNDRSFERNDWNGDGVLAGDEVRVGASRDARPRDTGQYDDGDDRFDALDLNRDNRISRDEWRDGRAAFDRLDENRDGRLTRAELSVAAADDAERFSILDVDRNGVITRGEWRGSAVSFTQLDRNGDGRLSPQEYEADDPSRTVVTDDDDRLYRPQGQATARNPATETRAYRAGYDRGLADGRNAGREDRERNQGWDLEGQRELERADVGFSDSLGSRTEYQSGYRAAFRLGYGEGYGPR